MAIEWYLSNCGDENKYPGPAGSYCASRIRLQSLFAIFTALVYRGCLKQPRVFTNKSERRRSENEGSFSPSASLLVGRMPTKRTDVEQYRRAQVPWLSGEVLIGSLEPLSKTNSLDVFCPATGAQKIICQYEISYLAPEM